MALKYFSVCFCLEGKKEALRKSQTHRAKRSGQIVALVAEDNTTAFLHFSNVILCWRLEKSIKCWPDQKLWSRLWNAILGTLNYLLLGHRCDSEIRLGSSRKGQIGTSLVQSFPTLLKGWFPLTLSPLSVLSIAASSPWRSTSSHWHWLTFRSFSFSCWRSSWTWKSRLMLAITAPSRKLGPRDQKQNRCLQSGTQMGPLQFSGNGAKEMNRLKGSNDGCKN